MRITEIKSLLLLIGLVSVLLINPATAGCYDKRAPGVDWSGCNKTNKMLDDNDFTGASMVKTDMSRSTVTSSRFHNVDLTKAVGYRADFDRVSFRNTNLTKSEFSRATFRNAELKDLDWSKSELGRVNFEGAQLQNINFQYSNLSRAVFTSARLVNIDFEGAYTYLTHFEGVDLRRVQGLSQLQIDISCGDLQTRLPEGRWIPDTWPCVE